MGILRGGEKGGNARRGGGRDGSDDAATSQGLEDAGSTWSTRNPWRNQPRNTRDSDFWQEYHHLQQLRLQGPGCHGKHAFMLIGNSFMMGNLFISWLGFPGGSVVKNPPAKAGASGLIPGLGRSPEEGKGNPSQYSCYVPCPVLTVAS